jgi:hypothetical protein
MPWDPIHSPNKYVCRCLMCPENQNATPINACLPSQALYQKKLTIQYSTSTTPIIMPASFKIAILFPCCAIRPSRPALDLIEVVMLEKSSFCGPLGKCV